MITFTTSGNNINNRMGEDPTLMDEEKVQDATIESPTPTLFSENTKAKVFPRSWLKTLLKNNPNPNTPTNLTSKALVVAPMVNQSDYPFRILCRKYGANLAYTPMIHSRLFIEQDNYRNKFWTSGRKESPLIAQFCGYDPEVLLKACRLICKDVDGIDLNCGCPQNIARRGHYGAYLLEKEDVLLKIVRTLSSAPDINVPICVKVRLLPSGVEDSLNLYRELVKAGASLICIHGRNRLQKGLNTGKADWDAIRRAVLDPAIGGKIPIFANGGISNLDDIASCLEHTQADGVMSSEAILEYPALFLESNIRISRTKLAREYLALARLNPPDLGGQGNGIKCVRDHFHRMLHDDLQQYSTIRELIGGAVEYDLLEQALDQLEEIHASINHTVQNEEASWYVRHASSAHLKTDGGIHFIPLIEEIGDDETCLLIIFDDDDADY